MERIDYASSHEYFHSYKCKTHPWSAETEGSETLTFHVTNVREVLALDDLLHDVVCVYARVVDPGWLILHRILFPPGINTRKCQLYLLWDIQVEGQYFMTTYISVTHNNAGHLCICPFRPGWRGRTVEVCWRVRWAVEVVEAGRAGCRSQKGRLCSRCCL